jgi:CRP-like cAMP-binding protein
MLERRRAQPAVWACHGRKTLAAARFILQGCSVKKGTSRGRKVHTVRRMPGEAMFLLKAGAAQRYRLSPDGRKFVFAEVPALSIFGEMACIGQAMYECFAEARRIQ